jgi:hypothetical protein
MQQQRRRLFPALARCSQASTIEEFLPTCSFTCSLYCQAKFVPNQVICIYYLAVSSSHGSYRLVPRNSYLGPSQEVLLLHFLEFDLTGDCLVLSSRMERGLRFFLCRPQGLTSRWSLCSGLDWVKAWKEGNFGVKITLCFKA